MLLGLGNDIIAIQRIDRAISRYGQKFLDKVFTPREQAYCKQYSESGRHFAGRFAAKEAIVKALGTGLRNGISWLDIEIVNDPLGKPVPILSESLNKRYGDNKILLTISHCKEFASAVAILEAL